jgi:hypothetical protein
MVTGMLSLIAGCERPGNESAWPRRKSRRRRSAPTGLSGRLRPPGDRTPAATDSAVNPITTRWHRNNPAYAIPSARVAARSWLRASPHRWRREPRHNHHRRMAPDRGAIGHAAPDSRQTVPRREPVRYNPPQLSDGETLYSGNAAANPCDPQHLQKSRTVKMPLVIFPAGASPAGWIPLRCWREGRAPRRTRPGVFFAQSPVLPAADSGHRRTFPPVNG